MSFQHHRHRYHNQHQSFKNEMYTHGSNNNDRPTDWRNDDVSDYERRWKQKIQIEGLGSKCSIFFSHIYKLRYVEWEKKKIWNFLFKHSTLSLFVCFNLKNKKKISEKFLIIFICPEIRIIITKQSDKTKTKKLFVTLFVFRWNFHTLKISIIMKNMIGIQVFVAEKKQWKFFGILPQKKRKKIDFWKKSRFYTMCVTWTTLNHNHYCYCYCCCCSLIF